MPPPLEPLPLEMVRFVRVTSKTGLVAKGGPFVWSTPNAFAPWRVTCPPPAAPLIVRSSIICGKALFRVIVQAITAHWANAKLMLSMPAVPAAQLVEPDWSLLLALRIASRSRHLVGSAVSSLLLTTMLLACASGALARLYANAYSTRAATSVRSMVAPYCAY